MDEPVRNPILDEGWISHSPETEFEATKIKHLIANIEEEDKLREMAQKLGAHGVWMEAALRQSIQRVIQLEIELVKISFDRQRKGSQRKQRPWWRWW